MCNVPRMSEPRVGRRWWLVAMPIVLATIVGCASATTTAEGPPPSSTTSTVPAGTSSTAAPTTTTTVVDEDVVAQPADFKNLKDMSKVRGMFVDNLLGHLPEAIAVAENPEGGIFPVGTVIQLVPQEAMIKRKAGFSPAFGDWEFFELVTSADGTVISKRGGAEVVNRFGGKSCAACHVKADIKFDFICEKTHGCDPLPVPDAVFIALQDGDNRPRVKAGVPS